MIRRTENIILARNWADSPLGRLTLAGLIRGGQGVSASPRWRVYGSFAIVYVLAGHGQYRDAGGFAQAIGPGDLIFVFPELPHTYGPSPGTTWDECYLVFEGPVFDLWRSAGLLDSRRPVHHLAPAGGWLDRMQAVAAAPPGASPPERALTVCRFLTLLTEMLAADSPPDDDKTQQDWLAEARRCLEADLGREMDLSEVAVRVGLSYEGFRKRFRQATGMAPAQFRAERRLEAARDLLRYTQMTSRQVAEVLGFADEFHFSKRFTRRFGESPRSFRAELRTTTGDDQDVALRR